MDWGDWLQTFIILIAVLGVAFKLGSLLSTIKSRLEDLRERNERMDADIHEHSKRIHKSELKITALQGDLEVVKAKTGVA